MTRCTLQSDAGHVVGVDLGGTKLLAGAVGPGSRSPTRRAATCSGRRRSTLLVDAIATPWRRSPRRSARGRARSGSASRARSTGGPASRCRRCTCRSPACHFAAVVGRARRPAGRRRQRRELRRARRGALRRRRAGSRTSCCSRSGTGIGGGLVLGGRALPRRGRRRRRAGPHGHRHGRPAVPGQLPEPRLPRGARVGHGAGARGRAARRPAAGHAARARAGGGRAAHRRARDRAAPTTATRWRATRSRRSAAARRRPRRAS